MTTNAPNLQNTYFWVTFFSIAMAFIESAVVVYLRAIYYPDGFDFPLVPIDQNIAITEILREAATMIMLVSIGVLAGQTGPGKFAWFIYCFGVWDIFYYVFLKLLLGWPESFLTWDILFLIPVTWTGPVITPIIISATMITFAAFIIHFNRKLENLAINQREIFLLTLGSLVLILSFVWDFMQFILEYHDLSKIWSLPLNNDLYELSSQYVPKYFNWRLFFAGELILLFTIYSFYRRNRLIIKYKLHPPPKDKEEN